MSISEIAKSIGESATLMLNAKAANLRKMGEPIIHLGGGEPKGRAPDDALTATAELLKSGEIRYTPASGTPELKQAVVRYTEEYYNHKVDVKNVLASSGAKQAIMVCLQAVLNPGDEVVFPAPYWVSYPDMTRLCGAIPVPAHPADGSLMPQLKDIEAVTGPRTKVVLINSPNNPSGMVYTEQFIADIVAYCEKNGLYLIMDDIYHRLIFDNCRRINCYDYAKDPGENSRLVVVNGVSKQYAMTGFRIGWAVASKALIEVMGNIQSHQTSCPSTLSQRAAVAALNGSQASVENLRLTLQKNRDVMMEQLATFPNVKIVEPGGTFYCFCDFSHYDEDSERLSNFLVDKVQVVTVPGVEFGVDGYLRLSFCGSVPEITEGIARMKWALDPDSPREIQIGDRKLVRER